MALPKKLQAQIENFLKDKKKSTGGWAPVDDDEIEALETIIGALISLKYEKDPDGDLPVSAHLTDRTRFKLPFILPIPHTVSCNQQVADLSVLHDAIGRHMSMAASNSESAKSLMQVLQLEIHQAASSDSAVKLAGTEYRPVVKPNDGVELTDEWLTRSALKRFIREEKKNPCPSDWSKRQAWAQSVTKALQEAWGVHVVHEACRITTAGVSVSLRIPAIDKVIRFDVGTKSAAEV